MPWPIPPADELASRYAGRLEASLVKVKVNFNIDPMAISRAVRSEKGVFSQLGRVTSLEVREVHDHVAWWGRMYFPDTAEEEFTIRHGDIWGVKKRGATIAAGTVEVTGTEGTIVPENFELRISNDIIFINTQVAEIGPEGVVQITVEALSPGILGNVETGTNLQIVEPINGVETVIVAGEGIKGGAEEEHWQEHSEAVQAHIRQRPHGGAGFDYPTWLGREFDIRAVEVLPDWIGRGSVGVAVVMKDGLFGRAPTETELDAMVEYLGKPGSKTGVRPVTAHVVGLAGVIREIPLHVRIRPDTIQTRAAVTEAWTRFVATVGDEDDIKNDGPIGALLEPSRIGEALSAAQGEYAHDLLSPNQPLQLERTEYPKPGNINFEGAA